MASEQTWVNNRLILSAGTVKEKLHNWKREEMKLYKDRMSFKRQIKKNQAHKITTTAYFVTASDYVIEN